MEVLKNTDVPLPRYVFWDVSPENLDISQNRDFIISRMFERGKLDDVLSTIAYYGKEETGSVLQDNKYLNRPGLFLAHALLGLPLHDFKAYATFKYH